MSMKQCVYSHGAVKDVTEHGLSYGNQAFLYGNSVFTSIRAFDGKVLFWSDHLERLKKSLTFLYPERSDDVVGLLSSLDSSVRKILRNHPTGHQYIRPTFFVEGGEFSLLGEGGQLRFIVYHRELNTSFCDNESRSVVLAPKRRIVSSIPSYIKSGNYLGTMIELKKAKADGFCDIVFVDDYDRLTEASTSNIFFKKGRDIFTPSLSGNLLDGICRKNLIRFFEKEGINLVKGNFKIDELAEADEAWLTNSISGITSLHSLSFHGKRKTYGNEWTKKIAHKFSEYAVGESLE